MRDRKEIANEFAGAESDEVAEEIVMEKGHYAEVGRGKKQQCEFAVVGIFVDGEKIGRTIGVCISKECKQHAGRKSEGIRLNPKEVAERKRQASRDRLKKKREEEAFGKAMLRIKWPLSDVHLASLFEMAMHRNGGESYTRPVVTRNKWEPIMRAGETYGMDGKKKAVKRQDSTATVRREFKKADKTGKARILVEVLAGAGYQSRAEVAKLF